MTTQLRMWDLGLGMGAIESDDVRADGRTMVLRQKTGAMRSSGEGGGKVWEILRLVAECWTLHQALARSCGQAKQTRQLCAVTCTQLQQARRQARQRRGLAGQPELAQRMPGADPLTVAITAAILEARGLADGAAES